MHVSVVLRLDIRHTNRVLMVGLSKRQREGFYRLVRVISGNACPAGKNCLLWLPRSAIMQELEKKFNISSCCG
jgi:hypothetical protein